MTGRIYLADTSLYSHRLHHPSVATRFEDLMLNGVLAVCQMTALEVLNSAPDHRRYEKSWASVHTQRWIDVGADEMSRALDVHRALAKRSQHRHFALPDLIIAATAELNGATVLHYDHDYDRIAEITGQPVEWVVPRGSL